MNTYAAETGRRLRSARWQSGLSLEEVAADTGFTATAICSWERGDRAMRVEYLTLLADTYGLRAADLLPNSKYPWLATVGEAS